MQFKKLREGCYANGERIRADTLHPGNIAHYYCDDCHNRLILHVTHTEGRYFEHDLERMDIESARDCRYRLTEDRPCSPDAQTAVSPIKLGWPSVEFYFCVLCDESYLGRKICPKCGEHIYTTEMKLRDPT